jgi:hypothetical protein
MHAAMRQSLACRLALARCITSALINLRLGFG